MSKLNRWLTVSKEDADGEFIENKVTLDDSELDHEIEAVEDEVSGSTDELVEATEAKEALEAYADLVRSAKARREEITPTLARAIYIGLESHNINTGILPSVESFGGLSVSVELLDKLKDGAKAVGNKIKEIIEYIKKLMDRFLDLFRDKKKQTEEKVKEVEKAVSEMKESPKAKAKPEVKAITSVKSESVATPAEFTKAIGYDKTIDKSANYEYIKINAPKILYLDGEFIGFDVAKLSEVLKKFNKTLQDYDSVISTVLLELAEPSISPIERAAFIKREMERVSRILNVVMTGDVTTNAKQFILDGTTMECEVKLPSDGVKTITDALTFNFKVDASVHGTEELVITPVRSDTLYDIIDIAKKATTFGDYINKTLSSDNVEKRIREVSEGNLDAATFLKKNAVVPGIAMCKYWFSFTRAVLNCVGQITATNSDR